MRRVIFEEKGGPEVLKFDGTTDAEEAITWMAYLNAYNLLTAPRVEPDLPSPATGEVRIKIKAIGLNRYESMFRQGVFWSRATRDLLESFRDVSVRPSTTPPAAPEEAQPHFPSPGTDHCEAAA
jgi:NADPH:quinone reductase-like Zn-dependent oxidoreductase